MMEADPDFLMGKVFCLVSEIVGIPSRTQLPNILITYSPNFEQYGGTYSNPELRKKVFDLKSSSEKMNISKW